MAGHHRNAIESLGGRASVCAVVDPVDDAREEMLSLTESAVGYPDLGAVPASVGVDAVHVCSPPPTHETVARQALERGCHVYVEKPFAESRTGAEELVRLAGSKRLQICAGHQLLFEHPSQRAFELLPALGSIAHLESYFAFRPVRRGRDGGPAMQTKDQLLDVLPHPVYLLLAFLRQAAPDEPLELKALEVGKSGTLHALVSRGALTGSLVVTLEGRPVESFMKVVGSNGTVHADYVRGTVQRLIGPGSSGIDKAFNPFRLARQMGLDTTTALGRRLLKRQRSYSGLGEILTAFYDAIEGTGPPALSGEDIVETVSLCEEVSRELERATSTTASGLRPAPRPTVAVTGGTGFLGQAVVRSLTREGLGVRVLSRRIPADWERLEGVEYQVADLGGDPDALDLMGIETVVHCAAETAGGWEAHERNSLQATEFLLRAAASGGVKQVVHVSSLAVLAGRGEPISEQTPLLADSRSRGPYVWGKLESEKIALRLATELGVAVKVVRPGALVDYASIDPPGRLGRRVGNLFVAVGSPRDRLGVTSVEMCAEVIGWMCENFDRAPEVVNLLDPDLPEKRSLTRLLKSRNPDLRVVWLPRAVLTPMAWAAILAQKIRRPGSPAINAAKVFARESYDTSGARELVRESGSSTSPDSDPRTGSGGEPG
jgi:predicted dehydrogenase/nucleoside-diphosphate-sugar epimerase